MDYQGYIVADINISPGSSGGLVFSKKGPVGVMSGDFKNDSGFKTVFLTPIARIKPVLLQGESPTKANAG